MPPAPTQENLAPILSFQNKLFYKNQRTTLFFLYKNQ